MGPALSVRSNQIVAGYASVAVNTDVQKMHYEKGIFTGNDAGIEKCPHASAARAAALMAEDLANAAAKKAKSTAAKHPRDLASASSSKASTSGCPFHQTAESVTTTPPVRVTPSSGFDYEQFYIKELDKKHEDKSYRYFNNINRLAAKFPVAHTGDVKDEVEVWCANDYLGMGNNPVVLETMQ
jgi:5-aminolevulinate synthase